MRIRATKLLNYTLWAAFLFLGWILLVHLVGRKPSHRYQHPPGLLRTNDALNGPRKSSRQHPQEITELASLDTADPLEKIDWHDYKKMAEEKLRVGPGEQGSAVHTKPEEAALRKKLYYQNGFNALASDKMSLNRSIRDLRHPECLKQKYRRQLPTVSIVVPFHQEHWSTLLRTAVSAINRSPDHLLKEVILVDDFSTKAFLKKKLDDYVAKNLPKVKVRL